MVVILPAVPGCAQHRAARWRRSCDGQNIDIEHWVTSNASAVGVPAPAGARPRPLSRGSAPPALTSSARRTCSSTLPAASAPLSANRDMPLPLRWQMRCTDVRNRRPRPGSLLDLSRGHAAVESRRAGRRRHELLRDRRRRRGLRAANLLSGLEIGAGTATPRPQGRPQGLRGRWLWQVQDVQQVQGRCSTNAAGAVPMRDRAARSATACATGGDH